MPTTQGWRHNAAVLENDTDDPTFSGYETVSINTGTIAAQMGNMTTGANDVLNVAVLEASMRRRTVRGY